MPISACSMLSSQPIYVQGVPTSFWFWKNLSKNSSNWSKICTSHFDEFFGFRKILWFFTKFLYKLNCQIKTPCCLTLKSEKTIGGEIVLHNDFLLYCTWNSPLRAEKKLENVQAHNSSIISILSCRVLWPDVLRLWATTHSLGRG